MKFNVEQIAIAPSDPAAARELLAALDAAVWHEDRVSAGGMVFGKLGRNVATLAFNYDFVPGKEFEVLHYEDGPNWLAAGSIIGVSHFGMHCTETELRMWTEFFKARGIGIAQEVMTTAHTNAAVLDAKRRYRYVIFNTRAILGVDLKFIVRLTI